MNSTFKVGIIGGTGFIKDSDIMTETKEINIATTPFGNPSDVLLEGNINGVSCVILSRHGRSHYISPTNVNYRANIWALKTAGVSVIIAVTACGSLREELAPGHFAVLDSFIDRTTKRSQTFYDGLPGHPEGICHIPMYPTFNEKMRQILISSLSKTKLNYQTKGTLVCVEGPRFSTRAESEVFRQWKADLIGMTLCPEVVLAKELGIPYASLAAVTDYDCWKDSEEGVNIDLVAEIMKRNSENLKEILFNAIIDIGTKKEELLKEINETKELAIKSVMDGGCKLDFEHI
uniref:S-methyl-5'-thioadenosine phosphorylase n=1 Tax=Meloidogyne incognita TaxID=6306 RepID=A0A914LVB4_MELIC